MCGGVRMMQGRRPTLIHISALVQKPDAMINGENFLHSFIGDENTVSVVAKNTVQEQEIMGYGGRGSYSETESVITKEQGSSSSSSTSSSAVGLGIVAAMSMELAQSPAATSRPSRPISVPAHQESDQRHSIFFTAAAAASPPVSSSVLYGNGKVSGDGDEYGEVVDEQSCTPGFLRACFLCRSPLRPGRDIYMYRGDRAFCSTECRYQQIDIDEYNERCPTMNVCKGDQMSDMNKVRCPTMNVCKGDQTSDMNKVNYHTVQIVG